MWVWGRSPHATKLRRGPPTSSGIPILTTVLKMVTAFQSTNVHKIYPVHPGQLVNTFPLRSESGIGFTLKYPLLTRLVYVC